jgi:hypothetical protein
LILSEDTSILSENTRILSENTRISRDDDASARKRWSRITSISSSIERGRWLAWERWLTWRRWLAWYRRSSTTATTTATDVSLNWRRRWEVIVATWWFWW